MTPLAIEYLPLEALSPYLANARTHSHAQIAQIAASITEFGWTNPILIDGKGGIIAGHGRAEAAKLLQIDSVPCIRFAHLTKQQKRALVIADNQLALNAGWDLEVLASELQALENADFDLGLTGIPQLEIDSLLGEPLAVDQSGDVAEDKPDPYTRKIEAPIYQPVGEVAPPASVLFDDTRTRALVEQIRAAGLPADVAEFLEKAAERHTAFHFARIAEFYAHAEPDVQRLMEASALVIIDFDRAIEHGFVKLTKRLGELIAEAPVAAAE